MNILILGAGTSGKKSLCAKAIRLILSKCLQVILSEVILPPGEPQPKVNEGDNVVAYPTPPCEEGTLTKILDALFCNAKFWMIFLFF